ncbi:MAG: alpha/beta hydrolase [Magnetospirillum sp. WYHS-4]
MKDAVVVAVHGWAFGAGFWLPLVHALPEAEFHCIDLGFRGAPLVPDLPSDGRRVVAMGHSLGALWLLTERPFRWDAFVGINAFGRFTDAVAPRVLERMGRRLEDDAFRVVGDFLALCGCTDRPMRLDVPRLGEGLHWLRDRDARRALDNDPAPALFLAARDDPLVPPAALGFPEGKARWSETGGHLLPRTRPEWCAAVIKEVLGA